MEKPNMLDDVQGHRKVAKQRHKFSSSKYSPFQLQRRILMSSPHHILLARSLHNLKKKT